MSGIESKGILVYDRVQGHGTARLDKNAKALREALSAAGSHARVDAVSRVAPFDDGLCIERLMDGDFPYSAVVVNADAHDVTNALGYLALFLPDKGFPLGNVVVLADEARPQDDFNSYRVHGGHGHLTKDDARGLAKVLMESYKSAPAEAFGSK